MRSKDSFLQTDVQTGEVEGLLPEVSTEKNGFMTPTSLKKLDQVVDLRDYKVVCILETSGIWNPFEPILVRLKSAVLFIYGYLNGSVESNSVKAELLAGIKDNFKVYKKVENGKLKIYIYCQASSNSPQYIWLPVKNIIEAPFKITDLTGYTEVNIS